MPPKPGNTKVVFVEPHRHVISKLKITKRMRRLQIYAGINNVGIFLHAVLLASLVFFDERQELITEDPSIFVPAGIHMFSNLIIGFIVTFDNIAFFRNQEFHSVFGNLSFFLFCLFEIIMVVNAFAVHFEHQLVLILGSAVMFVFIVCYVLCISMFYDDWNEQKRRIDQEKINAKIAAQILSLTGRGAVVTYIPLKGPLPAHLKESTSSKLLMNQPSTSKGSK